MTAALEKLRQQVKTLSANQQATLVDTLERDLQEQLSTEANAAWDEKIRGRVSEIEAGEAKLIPFDEVEAEMDEFVSSLQK